MIQHIVSLHDTVPVTVFQNVCISLIICENALDIETGVLADQMITCDE